MPKLWTGTLESHRREVREAVIATTTELVAEHGLRGVTMSRIAEEAGIGRATLYKYFPDVESILAAWHATTIRGHLDEFHNIAAGPGNADERLRAILLIHAMRLHRMTLTHTGSDIAAMIHRGDQIDQAQQELTTLLADLITTAATEGTVRADIPAPELAAFTLSALSAARTARSKAAVERTVDLALDALRSS